MQDGVETCILDVSVRTSAHFQNDIEISNGFLLSLSLSRSLPSSTIQY
jgi:hypothetical protein